MSTVFVSLEEKLTAPEITSFGAGSDWGDGVAGGGRGFEGFIFRAWGGGVGDE